MKRQSKVQSGSLMLLLVILMGDITPVSAQFNRLKTGERVKITAPTVSDRDVKGTVILSSRDITGIRVRGDSTIYISNDLIKKLAISRGKKRNTAKGATIGVVTGAFVLGVATAASNKSCGDDEWCILEFSDGEAFLLGAGVGGLLGAAVGAAIGAATSSDDWIPIPIDMTVQKVPYGANNPGRSVPSLRIRIAIGR